MAKDQVQKDNQAKDKIQLAENKSEKSVNKVDKDKKPEKKTEKKTKKKKRGNLVKEMIAELKKVTWPTRKELTGYCICVFVFVAIMGVIIGLMDWGSTWLIDLLTNQDTGLPSLFS